MAQADTTIYDSISEFSFGVDAGVAPLILPKNKLGFAINATVRGAFIQPRPPVFKKAIDFGGDATMESRFTKGMYQGGWWYRPDFGNTQLICQISGRLFALTENGDTWTCADISIAGDLNSSTAQQAWMWQAEKWLIISDGTGALPIFYDGVSCRRSYGPSKVLGIVTNTSSPTPPSIGATIVATLSAPYTGPFNVPVIFNKAFYQTVGSLTGNIELTNETGIAGGTQPSGTDVIVNPNLIGYTTGSASASAALISNGCLLPAVCFATYRLTTTLHLNAVGPLAVGNQIAVPTTNNGNQVYHVDVISGTTVTCHRDVTTSIAHPPGVIIPPPPAADAIATNTLVQFATNMGPNVILGQLTAPFVNPAVGATAAGSMSVPYSGPANQLVSINGFIYVINTVPVVGGTSLILINLSDTSAAAYVLPQDILSVPELPAGRMGTYGMGRVWMCLTDGISFIAGDIVGGAAGTAGAGTVANNYRDSVLKTTENDFLSGGGTFRLPGTGNIINSMTFGSTLDVALGQGPLQIGTDSDIFTCITPVDRTTWATITNPILTEALKGFGPLAQNSTVLANSDTIFRSVQGLGSLIQARRDFGIGDWGNTPISREMDRVFNKDIRSLLSYGSAVVFDNRLLSTAAPQVAGQGVFHIGAVALNFDLLSNLRGKAPPVYDGLWTGLNALQYIKGIFSGIERGFAFGFNITTQEIELYELVRTDAGHHFDNGDTRIQWSFETATLFKSDIKPITDLIRLLDGEFMVQEVIGKVDFEIQYRPDYWPCWVPWRTFSICAKTTGDNVQPGYLTRIGLGEPDGTPCEEGNNRPLRVGHFFQFRFVITGQCKFMGARFAAVPEPTQKFAPPVCGETCDTDLPLPP